MNNEIYKKCMIIAFCLVILGLIWYAINGIIAFDPFEIIVSLGFICLFSKAVKKLRQSKN